jgi:hypothetical protein
MEAEPEQGALFYLEGPDEDGCVWISSADAGASTRSEGPLRPLAHLQRTSDTFWRPCSTVQSASPFAKEKQQG